MADFDNAPEASGGDDSLHADLAAAFDGVAADVDVPPVEINSPEPAPSSDTRARDEAGRFAKAAENAAAPVEPEHSGTDTNTTDPLADAGTVEAPVEAPILAPVSWSAEDKAMFAKLPPEAQKVIARRESERDKAIAQKSQEAAELRKRYDAIEQVIAPRRQELAIRGVSEAQAISQLIAINDFATKDPQGYLTWAAQQLGVNLAQFGQPAEPDNTDPHVKNLEQRLARFEQMTAQQQRAEQDRIRAAQQQAHQMSIADIEAFASETDASGAPARPYFQHVINDLLPITQLIRQSNPTLPNKEVLQQAYDRAVWANPETRQAVIEHDRRQAEAKQRAEAAKKAADAKRASASVTGAPGGMAANVPKVSLREELEAAFGAS